MQGDLHAEKESLDNVLPYENADAQTEIEKETVFYMRVSATPHNPRVVICWFPADKCRKYNFGIGVGDSAGLTYS